MVARWSEPLFPGRPGRESPTSTGWSSRRPHSQITDLFTGVSGITETSPALSVAQRSGRLVYSVFRANGYEVYAIDSPQALAGASAYGVTLRAGPHAAFSRRSIGGDTLLVDLLHDSDCAVRRPRPNFPVRPLPSGLALTYVGRPSLVAGSSQFGTYVGGGAALYFSDILGNHNLVTGLEVQGSLKDVNALVGYQNLSHRLNWGVAVQQMPYVTGGFAEGTATVNGEPAFVEQQLLQRQTNRDIFGSRVVSLQPGPAGRVSGRLQQHLLRARAPHPGISLLTGDVMVDDKVDLPAPQRRSTSGVASAALVYDNSFFGATSPILGQRYRLEVSPTVGSLNYVGVLGDYRRVLHAGPPVHLCHPAAALRPLRQGRRGSPAPAAVPRAIRGWCGDTISAPSTRRSAIRPPATPMPARSSTSCWAAAWWWATPSCASRCLGARHRLRLLRRLPDRVRPVRRRRPGLGQPAQSLGLRLRHPRSGLQRRRRSPDQPPGLCGGGGGPGSPFDRPGKGWVWQFELQPGF